MNTVESSIVFPFTLNLSCLIKALQASRGFTHKQDIHQVMCHLDRGLAAGLGGMTQNVAVGDDCAVLAHPSGSGHLLLAIEGLVSDFVSAQPWFAGYSAVLVNISDVYAMGGRPLAVVDALWASPAGEAAALLDGMAAAADRYGVPLVGGHSNLQSEQAQLAVAILGHAQALISSFDARPGDTLMMAVDLRGRYQDPYPFWNASTEAPGERLRADLELLPLLAEDGLCSAGKDISMAGALGTALMLLESSGVGAEIELSALPRPPEIHDEATLLRWLMAFPSFGFILSVSPQHVAQVRARFAARNLACAAIGAVHRGTAVTLRCDEREEVLWDFSRSAFIGAAARRVGHG